jgi:hypothetical protein
MLLELHDTVLPEHREAIEAELERLAVTVELNFGGSVDFDRAAHTRPTGHRRAHGLCQPRAGAVPAG